MPSTTGRSRVAVALGPGNIGGVYVLVVISAVFALLSPQVFLSTATVSQVLNGNAVMALAGLAVLVPLSAGVFDVSGGGIIALSGVVTACMVSRSDSPLWLAVLLALLVSAGVGVVNGFVVVYLGIDSLIGTLASGSLIAAFITMLTNDNDVNDPRLLGSFSKLSQREIGGFALPVVYVVVLALVLWFFMEHTATGRRLHAIGFNARASQLAGIRVKPLRFFSFIVSGTISGFAGIVLASQIGSGSPSAGATYLLPAFAVAFVGATQFGSGRFNVWGTLIAVIILGVGVTGLALVGAAPWAGDMFTGAVLIIALAVTGVQRDFSSHRMVAWIRRRTRGSNAPAALDAAHAKLVNAAGSDDPAIDTGSSRAS